MDAPAPSALIHATREALMRHAPFNRMATEHLDWMAVRMRLAYYAKDEVILSPEQGVAKRFFVIKQGCVLGEQGASRPQETTPYWELNEGECFPLGALLAGRGVASLYRAREDTFCYELPAEDFAELLRLSPPFQDFCTRRIASLLEQSKQLMQAEYSHSLAEQQPMSSPLINLIRQQPVVCGPDTPLEEALETMGRLGIGSMIVIEDGRPLGILTLHDVLTRVTLPRRSLAESIRNVMSTGLVFLPPQALAHEAALAMARHGIRHVLVCDNERLVGVVSEKDLFSLQRLGLHEISSAIRSAADPASLQQAGRDIRQLAKNMMAQGVAAEQLTQFLSTLNDLLTCRVIELECAAAGITTPFCWLALGSEGRYEQTLSTDQDNGIIFAVPDGATADQVREQLLPVARRINQALDACGFPLCKGEIMAGNPKWCLSLAEWKAQFADWIHRGDAPVLLNAAIFFDFRPLWGEQELATELRHWLHGRMEENRLFLKHMVENALANRIPLGLIRDFVLGEAHTLDLKINGITPFVDAARIFSLAAGVSETGTTQRLRAIGERWRMDSSEVQAWIDAFLYIQLLRLRRQQQQAEAGQPLGNHIDPDSLNPLDQRILKEAFRQGRKLQARMGQFFQF